MERCISAPNEVLNEKQFVSACSTGKVDKVKLGLDEGLSAESTDQYGLSALILAARKGHVDIAKLLIDYGADIEFFDRTKRTALFHATCFDRQEMIRFLVSRGAQLDVVDNHGWTPCKMAESLNNYRLVELLRSLGAKRCTVENDSLEITVSLDTINAKDRKSSFFADEIVQKIRKNLHESKVRNIKDQLEFVNVVLFVGANEPRQPISYQNRIASTFATVPDCMNQDEMNRRVVHAVSNAFSDLGQFLKSKFANAFDYEAYFQSTNSAVERLI